MQGATRKEMERWTGNKRTGGTRQIRRSRRRCKSDISIAKNVGFRARRGIEGPQPQAVPFNVINFRISNKI